MASSSEIIRVTARFIPEVARVMPKRYTLITNWYIPIYSDPIFCEIYAVKYISIPLKIKEVIIKIEVLKIKNLNFFKDEPPKV